MPPEMPPAVLPLLLSFIFLLPMVSGAFVGVNIGMAMADRPKAEEVVRILQDQEITHVRLLDPDRELLKALAGTGIQVMLGLPNNELLRVGQSRAAAADWVKRNVASYLPATNITSIAVGSEVLTVIPNAALVLFPAMRFLHSALLASNLDSQVKVSTPQSMDIIFQPFPPSAATFNSSWLPILFPILRFLQNTRSFFMLNAHPYYGYVKAGGIFPLDYALFRPLPSVKQIVDPNTLSHYNGMFDAMVDAAFYSMAAANFSTIPIVVTETGWPWQGGTGEPDATVENALTYNANLIRRVINDTGTSGRPGAGIGTYIYEMFDEDMKAGPVSARSWGVYFPNGTAIYSLAIGTGVTTNTTSGPVVFCVARPDADPVALKMGLDWACGPGSANCTAIQQGQPCFLPDTLASHASYAYSDYYRKTVTAGGTCDFNGTATLSYSDPSHGSCVYVGSSSGSTATPGGSSGGTGGGGTAMGPTAMPPSSGGNSRSPLVSHFCISTLWTSIWALLLVSVACRPLPLGTQFCLVRASVI
ncbi:glucan endo-1,3-beta-glucosidase 4-like isoform X3 [Nymphaea colorata]|uniref:glucan endo-1,3-beta-glucosidase 4-like isoform X3 n=1 Tax=Nymphaea colorata TaxID=210225 RepID=UPI00129E0778|nr:glucan endo-1,3-beta-glucosidase 4-like isoform X3 [Nymphaea colorata]